MNNNFSENLKKIRKDNNLSQEQLAYELGVSRQAISKWESASAYPEMDKIIALCDKFNLNIDDLLHKDIREIKSEEETKKNLNKYIDDFLSFITNTINMFSNMSFKSKIKCLFEQFVIAIILLIVICIIAIIGENAIFGVFYLVPDKVYFVIFSIIKLIYIILSFLASLIIIIHIFKTRYLDYYDKVKNDVKEKNNEEDNTFENNKVLFKENENKIIIRDPKHSEYKFINGILKFVITIIKFFALCFSFILSIILIALAFCFVISFLTYKTGLFFIGLLVLFISMVIIDVNLILVVLNFVFNRRTDKKKIIWFTIISIIFIGIGSGLISVGMLNFEYIEDKSILKTEYIEFDMKDDLFFESYYINSIEYIESDIDNIKVEYQINKYCDIDYSLEYGVHIGMNCNNPIKIANEILEDFNDKKIISVSKDLESIKIYASKQNIKLLKKNYELHFKNIEFDNIN